MLMMRRRWVASLLLLLLLLLGEAAAGSPTGGKEVLFVVWTTTWGRVSEDYTVTCGSSFGGLRYRVTGDRSLADRADALIFHGPDTGADFPPPGSRRPEQCWVIRSMESAANDRRVDRTQANPRLALFNLSSTYSRRSDAWIPYMPERLRSLQRAHAAVPAARRTKSAPVAWVGANCGTVSRREDFVRELARHVRVDSFGSCMHTRDWDAAVYGKGGNATAFRELLASYRFYIALENSQCEDYLTEKYWRSLQLGVVPIVWGNTARDFEPSARSVLRVSDFETVEALAAEISRLSEDDAAFEEFVAWKRAPASELSPAFLALQTLPRGECPLAARVLEAAEQLRTLGIETHVQPDNSCQL